LAEKERNLGGAERKTTAYPVLSGGKEKTRGERGEKKLHRKIPYSANSP